MALLLGRRDNSILLFIIVKWNCIIIVCMIIMQYYFTMFCCPDKRLQSRSFIFVLSDVMHISRMQFVA